MIIDSVPRHPEFVNPDMLSRLIFGLDDALPLPLERNRRMQDLARAADIGQRHQGKVKMIFRTSSGNLKRVYATVRAYNTQLVYFQAAASLPVRSIVRIEFF